MGIRTFSVATLALAAAFAAPAHADSRDIQSAVDGYLAGQRADAALVGGPGSAGYDSGFWIRGGDFSLRMNITLQARYEAYDYDELEPNPGRDLSGFSLPRALVKFSGTAPCNTCYYIELDFGHFGSDVLDDRRGQIAALAGWNAQSENYENTREAWIEWCSSAAFNFRMGQILTPNTRQLMTAPELQQFVDISAASAYIGRQLPGYTDRNRDHGLMVHGAFGCNNELSYMFAVTNGDGGDSIRNVVDNRSDDNLALSARVNWAFLKPIYYEEGALRQTTCEWYGEVGAWAHSYDARVDGPHAVVYDGLVVGADLALGWGGFSFTAAYTLGMFENWFGATTDLDTTMVLVQVGYLFPGTAWEIAARYSNAAFEFGGDGDVTEIAGVVNYYLNGHSNKLSLDVTMLEANDFGSTLQLFDLYSGLRAPPGGDGDSNLMIRFQWQLAL
jgi:hypothetical protein